MGDTIKLIFRTLIGTVFAIVIISLAIEMFNISVTSFKLMSACNMSASQAMDLFAQETYREIGSGGGTVNLSNIKDIDGNNFISGNVYGTDDASQVYAKLYGVSNSSFKKIADLSNGKSVSLTATHIINGTSNAKVKYTAHITRNSTKGNEYVIGADDNSIKTVYSNVAKFYAALYKPSTLAPMANKELSIGDVSSDGSFSSNQKKKIFATAALKMSSEMYTPVNLGFPYFDPTVTNKMFQWNLAQLLSNNNKDKITKDTKKYDSTEISKIKYKVSTDKDKYYVEYNGFKCYVRQAYINKLDYYIYNTNNKDDLNEVVKKIPMSKSKIQNLKNLENQYITVVRAQYTMPVVYEGISPLKDILKFAFKNEKKKTFNSVRGTDGVSHGKQSYGTTSHDSNIDGRLNGSIDQKITNNGEGGLNKTGEVYYILVR